MSDGLKDKAEIVLPAPKAARGTLMLAPRDWPQIILRAGATAQERFLEFFAATIRNENTREAYFRAVLRFLRWADEARLDLGDIRPIHVASYIELFTKAQQDDGTKFSSPTIKQHLAAIKMLFDFLVTGQVVPSNPASSVRGPKYVIRKGKTPVLSAAEAKQLLDSIDVSTPVGLRDRALIGTMLYSFARVSAVVGMRVSDYFTQGKRGWIRLHEKGGKEHEVPCHHKSEEFLDAFLKAAGIEGQKNSPLWRSTRGRTNGFTDKGMTRVDVFRMIQRRAEKAELSAAVCCHSFRATGITVFLENGGAIETAAQIAAHESPRTTKLYDRRVERVALEEVERIRL